MSDRALAPLILVGAATVFLAGAAAYFGSQLGKPPAPAVPPEGVDATSDEDPAVRESVERQMKYLEKRVETLEDEVRNLQGSRTVEAPRVGVPLPPPRTPSVGGPTDVAPAPAEPEKPRAVDPEDREALVARMAAIGRANAKTVLVGQMAAFADTGREAPANRQAQALSDAHALMAQLGLRGDATRDQFAKIYKERLESAARDIGPIVRDGLERTDIATVRARLRTLDAETDKKLRALLDDEQWKRYEANAAATRQTTDALLDEFEKARLSGK